MEVADCIGCDGFEKIYLDLVAQLRQDCRQPLRQFNSGPSSLWPRTGSLT
jgi:hypothetical protein